MGVIRLRHPTSHWFLGRGRRCRDNQSILFLVLIGWEVRALPCAYRPTAVETQEEDQLFPGPKIVRIVNIELTSSFLVYRADTAHIPFSGYSHAEPGGEGLARPATSQIPAPFASATTRLLQRARLSLRAPAPPSLRLPPPQTP